MLVRFSRIKYRCIHCGVEYHLHESNYDRLCQPCGEKDDERLSIVEYLIIHDKYTYANNRKKLCEDVEGLLLEDIVRWIKEGRLQVTAGGGLRSTATAKDVSEQVRNRLEIIVAQNKIQAEEKRMEAAQKGTFTAEILEQMKAKNDSMILEKFQRGAPGPVVTDVKLIEKTGS